MLEDFCLPGDMQVSEMPHGFDQSKKQDVEGRIELKHIDFFDYLPKEDAETFKKALRKFALSNRVPMFSFLRTREVDDRVDSMGRYFDGPAFSNLYSIAFSHNDYLIKYAPQIDVSIHNLSTSFLVAKYRVYISDTFNEELQQIYKGEYQPFSDVSPQFNIPWYKPWKFGRSTRQSDDARYKAVYLKLSELKWAIYKEIKKNVKIYFADAGLFPPTFATYHTNIRPSSNRKKLNFWYSIGLDYAPDYSQLYNLCVGWDRNISENEGLSLSAFCGSNYTNGDYTPGIAEHNCADIYCAYMVADTLRSMAERDIAICNKWISKAIRKAGSIKLLKVRAAVEKNLYYSYRFMSEFTGEAIDMGDFPDFRNPMMKKGSFTESRLNRIADYISETKDQIDAILHLLDDSAEFRTAKSTLALQLFMMVITILSLIVAVIAMVGFKTTIKDYWPTVSGFCKDIFERLIHSGGLS